MSLVEVPMDEEEYQRPPKMTRKDWRRQQRIQELQTLYSLASGAYTGGNASGDHQAIADRALSALEKLIIDTPFTGG